MANIHSALSPEMPTPPRPPPPPRRHRVPLAPLNTRLSCGASTPTPAFAVDAPPVRPGRDSMSIIFIVPFSMMVAEFLVALDRTDPCLVDQRSISDGDNNIDNDKDGAHGGSGYR